ncbi:TetR/AcrR family transcriptional regulator [Rhizobium leguminosarum]|uniref:TetR/AcrR family transcriptional regulator n=1 Tax=Rhizobium leguminosarum TaxID=384 RepID=UPI003F99BD9B
MATQVGRKRFAPEERRQRIVDGAIAFFSENGLDGSTHRLANYLGVTQPLIYQYFPNKEDLIDAVYEELFRGRWNEDWDLMLADRSRSLYDRLLQFYREYSVVMHAPEWIRIYLGAGLKHHSLIQRYNAIVEVKLIGRICEEVRADCGLPAVSDVPMTDQEFEIIWTLHGGLFYHGVRRYVYGLETARNFDAVIESVTMAFLEGLRTAVKRLVPST